MQNSVLLVGTVEWTARKEWRCFFSYQQTERWYQRWLSHFVWFVFLFSKGSNFSFSCSFLKTYQWNFLVPLIGGRYHIIRQLAVYTTYIPLIYHLYTTYIPLIYHLYIAYWVIIYHLPPIKGTRNSYWNYAVIIEIYMYLLYLDQLSMFDRLNWTDWTTILTNIDPRNSRSDSDGDREVQHL